MGWKNHQRFILTDNLTTLIVNPQLSSERRIAFSLPCSRKLQNKWTILKLTRQKSLSGDSMSVSLILSEFSYASRQSVKSGKQQSFSSGQGCQIIFRKSALNIWNYTNWNNCWNWYVVACDNVLWNTNAFLKLRGLKIYLLDQISPVNGEDPSNIGCDLIRF